MSTKTLPVGAIILGAQKCATSTLFEILKTSPDINASTEKELDFWSLTRDWRAGLEDYHARFADRPGLKLEASPSYTMAPRFNPEIWEDMHEYNPDLRLIYLYRKPLDRMRSAYKHAWERGWISCSFAEFLERDPPRRATRYAMQIAPFIECFGRESVLILDQEVLVGAARLATLASIEAFLGIGLPDVAKAREVHANRGSVRKPHHRFDNPAWPLRLLRRTSPRLFRALVSRAGPPALKEKPSASPEAERAFIARLEADIAAFEKIVDRDLSHWREI